ncbi:hypothetical protein BgiMline_022815, partial [Biomphalaria glabrata]
CAVIGCYAQRSKCRGLSFHKLPKKSTNNAWRNALITAIDRVDSRFNPDTARICSRHFKESCFVPTDSSKCATYKNLFFKRKPHYLIPGSLPTEYMPQNAIVTPKQLPSKLPVQLPPDPPPLPECVKYRQFSELKKDVCNPECLPSPWCLLEANDNHVLLGMMNDMKTSVKLKLNISEELIVSASIMENFYAANFVLELLMVTCNHMQIQKIMKIRFITKSLILAARKLLLELLNVKY